ncbi:unnamed protein product [Calypogeia fissa]
MAAAAESLVSKKDKRRLLHVVYRVGNLERTIQFNTEDSYDIGTGFGNFGIVVEDVQKVVDLAKATGATISRERGPAPGKPSEMTAIFSDPDGYSFELIERSLTADPIAHVSLNVLDLEKSIEFYEKGFGLALLSKDGVLGDEFSIARLGYGDDEKNTTTLELRQQHGVSQYSKGTGYAQIAVGTDDVYKTAEALRAFGGKITREPGPLPGINTKITAVLDPDGWKSVFVDNADFSKELE